MKPKSTARTSLVDHICASRDWRAHSREPAYNPIPPLPSPLCHPRGSCSGILIIKYCFMTDRSGTQSSRECEQVRRLTEQQGANRLMADEFNDKGGDEQMKIIWALFEALRKCSVNFGARFRTLKRRAIWIWPRLQARRITDFVFRCRSIYLFIYFIYLNLQSMLKRTNHW